VAVQIVGAPPVKILSVRCLLLSCPYAIPGDLEREHCFVDGHRTISVIKIETDEGVYGLGETYTGVFAPEAVRELVSQFERELIGKDPSDIAELRELLRVACYYWGRFGMSASVVGGIEMALWDLRGKVLDVPVHQLLGGRVHDRIKAYASGGNNKPFPELRAELEAYLRDGYRAVKIRINFLSAPQIVEKVAFCREVLGPDIGLAVDAVQGVARKAWTTKEALAVIRSIEEFDLLWVEEPCEVTDYAGFAEVRRGTSVTVAGGETVTSLVEAEAYLSAGALDLFQPDAAILGGIAAFRQVADMCARRNVNLAVHTWAGGVGIMGNYHAAFASRNCVILELPNNPYPLREEFLVEPLRIVDGAVAAPAAPGLGVKLPEDVEQRYPYQPGSYYRVLGHPKKQPRA
jgi:L-alanine-DL-glutamate epimerase-like enolase superfamily enzyme